MRKLIATVIVLALITCFPTSVKAQDFLDSILQKKIEELTNEIRVSKEVQKSTVSILNLGRSAGFCSGVIVDEKENKTYVITCKHCVGPTEEVMVENEQASIIFTPVDDDLALIIVNGKIPNKKPASLAKTNPNLGDKLIHIGYPIFELYESYGELIRTSKDWHWGSFESKGGCSGGGIYNEQKELVGILWGGLTWDPVSMFEPIEDVHNFINKTKRYIKW